MCFLCLKLQHFVVEYITTVYTVHVSVSISLQLSNIVLNRNNRIRYIIRIDTVDIASSFHID